MKLSTVLLISMFTSISAFSSTRTFAFSTRKNSASFMRNEKIGSFDPLNFSNKDTPEKSMDTLVVPVALFAALVPEVANAAGPDWGLFEGKTGSLLHPVVMGSMFLLSCTTAFKGFQYRRQRTLGDDITALKKNLPNLGGAASLKEAIAQAETGEDAVLVSKLKAALPIQNEIDALVAERKELTSQNVRESHWNQGAILAFMGTAFAIEGPLNTYARAGKLFPGPHLYAGAGLVVLWAAAAACVPFMQKGNDTARSIHIIANASGMGLFVWQVVTGFPILLKVNELTHWP